MTKVLRIDASMRHDGSTTRRLTDAVIARLAPVEVRVRDLSAHLPLIDATWIGANFTDPAERTEAQQDALALSDALVAEIEAVDTLVIGLPVYNFGVPAAFKAWIDLIARARVTFRYTESGPIGLLEGKRAIVVAASGGTPIGGEIDFATPYVRHMLGFVGINDVLVIGAGQQMADQNAAIAGAEAAIAGIAA